MAVNPPDPVVLQRLDPAHRQLVKLLYRLYEQQQKLGPRSLKRIANTPPLHGSASGVTEALHGTGRVPPTPKYAERLAEALGGSPTQVKKAAAFARDIGHGGRYDWVLAGERPRDHVMGRALGHRPGDGRGGDLFTGRTRALSRVTGWLQSTDSPAVPLVVTGQPGAGKSSVVARATRDLEAAGVRDGLFFHARSTTHADLLGAARQVTGDESITDTVGWQEHLHRRAVGEQSPLLVIVDALDEAASSSEQIEIARMLTAVAALPAARIVVATRAGRGRKILRILGVRDADDWHLVDLDSDEYFEADDIVRVAATQLTQDGAAAPGPPGHAWTGYRTETKLTERLARAIARRANRNFLVAAFAAHSLSTESAMIDPSATDFQEQQIPSSVEEAFEKYFESLESLHDERRSFRTRRLLTALAFARGPGLDDDTWLEFAAAMGVEATRQDQLELRNSPVVDYLLESRPEEPGYPQPVRRLYHQALADQLLQDAEADDEHRILHQLIPTGTDTWSNANPYVYRYLVDHAAATGELLTLLRQPEYLAIADLQRVLANLPARPTGELQEITAILRQCIHRESGLQQGEVILLFAVAAAQLGLTRWQELFNRVAMRIGYPTVAWTHPLTNTPHQTLVGNGGLVHDLAMGRLGDRDIIVTGDMAMARVWDTEGNQIGEPLIHTDNRGVVVTGVAVGRLGDRDVIVTAGDLTARIWDTDGNPIGEPLTGPVRAVAIGRLGDRDVIVTAGDLTARIWDTDGNPIGEPLTGHTGPVSAVAIGRLGDRDVIVTAGIGADGDDVDGSDATVRIWDTNGNALGDPFSNKTRWISVVAMGQLSGRDVIATGGGDDTVRIWDADGKLINELTGHTDFVTGVAIGRLGNRDMIASAGGDRTVRIWDADGKLINELIGHTDLVNAVAIGRLGDRDVIVSAGDDATVRIWETGGNPMGDPLTGHTGLVTAMAVGRLSDRDVIVTAGRGDDGTLRNDATVRIWDTDGNPIGDPLIGHTGSVSAMAIRRLGERNVIVTAGAGTDATVEKSWGTVRIWDTEGNPISDPVTHPGLLSAIAIDRLGDRDVIVTAGADRTVRIWDTHGNPIGAPLTGHTSWVGAVAIGRFDDRDCIVAAGGDGTVRMWEATSRTVTTLSTISEATAVATGNGAVYAAVGPAIMAWRHSSPSAP